MNHPSHIPTARWSNGFTLVELLVVVSIIAVLAARLLLALSRAKMKAMGTECLGNERQLALAWLMFADHYEDRACKNSIADGNGWSSGLMDFKESNRGNTNTLFLADAGFATLPLHEGDQTFSMSFGQERDAL